MDRNVCLLGILILRITLVHFRPQTTNKQLYIKVAEKMNRLESSSWCIRLDGLPLWQG